MVTLCVMLLRWEQPALFNIRKIVCYDSDEGKYEVVELPREGSPRGETNIYDIIGWLRERRYRVAKEYHYGVLQPVGFDFEEQAIDSIQGAMEEGWRIGKLVEVLNKIYDELKREGE